MQGKTKNKAVESSTPKAAEWIQPVRVRLKQYSCSTKVYTHKHNLRQ